MVVVALTIENNLPLLFMKKNLSKTPSLQFLVLRLKSFGGTRANLYEHASEEATKKQRNMFRKSVEGSR